MPYIPFHDFYPEIAEKEVRCFVPFGDKVKIPNDKYVLMELYCDEDHCDCRRVMFNVFSDERQSIDAVVAYGWETKVFYEKWCGESDPVLIESLKGPCLNMGSYQSKYADELLGHVEVILKDVDFVERLKRHYTMFRKKIDQPKIQKISEKSIGRNDLCHCGSGKKFKKCCLPKP